MKKRVFVSKLTETEEKELIEINEKLEELIKKGANDESLNSRRKELLFKKYSPKI